MQKNLGGKMRDKVVDDFFHSAIHYCGLIESFNSVQASHKLKILLVSILDLYSKALYLPEIEPVKDEVTDFDSSVPQINFNQYDLYWEVFNPYQLEKPVAASLSDDILEIYKDVKKGIHLYEKKEHLEAVWEWNFSFEVHWGSHAVDAIRALHSAIFL